MYHTGQYWTEALPLVLLGIRTAFKGDLQASVAEFVYGEPLRIPGELLAPTADPVDPAHFITYLRHHMARLRPIPKTRHASPSTFVHSDLEKCTHVFLRQEAARRAVEPPYSGPYQVLSRRENNANPEGGRPVTVSTDRVKPDCMLNETARETTTTTTTTTTTSNSAADATPAAAPQPVARTTRSGRHVRFPVRFNC
jgi:hypothetical protein